jgi:EAL domain-containing protein (putative c-di-GMP-specific phosphodiesterase class I)
LARDRRLRWTIELDGPPQVSGPVPTTPPVRDLDARHLGVVYQPIVDLNRGRMRASEALVRCNVEAYRNPERLFEIALEQDSVGRLGRAIREVTFEQAPGQPLFVNVHPEELRSRWIVRPDDALFMHSGELFLEITESAALDYFDLCRSVLKEVCARSGAHLVIDDLGAGYSNLKRVIDLEPKVVKLDRALITGIDKNRRQHILVEQLVRTCAALGAEVVAEGIETEDELRAIRDAGVTLGQGYFLARPAFPIPDVHWPG